MCEASQIEFQQPLIFVGPRSSARRKGGMYRIIGGVKKKARPVGDVVESDDDC